MSRFQVLPEALPVRTAEEARSALQYFAAHKPEYLGVDTEGPGLSTTRDYAVILALSDGHRRYAVWPNQIRKFRALLLDESITLLMANAKFDLWMLANIGIDIWENTARTNYRVIDVQVMHHLWCDWHPHGLKWLAKRLLGIEMVDFTTLFGKSDLEAKYLDPEYYDVVCNYASLDAYATYELFWLLRDLLDEETIDLEKSPLWKVALQTHPELRDKTEVTLWDYFRISEQPFTRVLYECERNGLPLNVDAAVAEALRLEAAEREIERWFAERLQDHLNLNLTSDAYMRKFFYGKLGYKHQKKTDTGQKSLDEEVLQDWILEHDCEYARQFLRLRKGSKILGTYLGGALREYRQHPDGARIHPTLKQIGAGTGRLSSAAPNLQNLPQAVRFIYEAPRWWVLAAPDYSQLEVRLMAHMAEDEDLLDAIRKGQDLHAATAALMFGVNYDDIIAAKDKSDRIDEVIFRGDVPSEKLSQYEKDCIKKRKAAKTITFGLAYGQGAGKLAQDLNVSRDEAKSLIAQYFRRFKGVKAYFERQIAEAERLGYCTTLMGRRRYLPHFWSHLKGDQARAERQTKNSPIQGGAADVVKWAMLRLWEDPLLHQCGVLLCLQVHDEVVLLVPEEVSQQPWFAEHVEHLMAHPLYADLLCPLHAGMKYGRHYGACK